MLRTTLVSALMLIAVAVSGSVRADGDYIWCVIQDAVDDRPRSVYSAVFRGDWRQARAYERAFRDYIHSQMGIGHAPQVACHRKDSLAEARRARDDYATQARMRFDRQVVFARWAY